uniref:mRNA n=1 Tax=Oulactis sp. TaxID=2093647 RepID=A0A8J9XDZ5_OULSP|nr:mRNA [Oulactis sp. MM-2018]
MFSEKSLHVLRVFLVLCLLLHLVSATCNSKGQCWKTSEAPNKSVDFHLCGSMIPFAVRDICNIMMAAYGRRKQKARKSSGTIVYKNPNNAKRFRIAKRKFNIVEECCTEGCLVEEVREYC